MAVREHRRRRYARIPTSILREPWPEDVKWSIVKLQLYLSDRWARDDLDADEACRALLDRPTLAMLTGKGRADIARTSARRWADFVSMSVELRGDFVSIEWPKFAEFQGLTGRFARSRGASADAAAPADSTPPISPPSRRTREPRGPTLFPEAGFTDAQKRELAASPSLKGRTPEDLRQAVDWARDWSAAGAKRRVDWVAVVRNGIRGGYALRGNGADKPEARARRNSADVERLLRGPQASQDAAGAGGPDAYRKAKEQ